MNYKDYKDNPKSFRALTGLTHIQFSHLLPYFEAAHDDYLSEYEMNGKRRSQLRSFCIYKNSPLADVTERLFFILVYLKNNPLQEYHAACFGMDQKHCNTFVHCLPHILRLSLETMGLVPAQTDKELFNCLLELSKDGLEPVLLHDGTEREIPRPVDYDEQKEQYSGKKKRHTVKNGVVITTSCLILFVSQTIPYFSLALLSGLLLGSCSQNDSVSEVSTKALEIHASLAQTQTGVSVRSTSALTSGSLGVFLSDANDYTSRDNVQYTYADGSWSSAAPVYLGVNSATVCAYYPYDANLTGASSVVLTSQVYAPGKDFCYAVNNTALSMGSPNWSMQFEHAYSEVTLNITRDASYLGTCSISKVSLINSGLNVSGSLDITRGVYSNLAQGDISYDPDIVSLSSGSSTSSSVLLVPVESLSGTLSIALAVDGKTMLANIDAFSAGLSSLDAGVNYTIDLSVKGGEISISGVSVSDWESVAVSDSQLLESIASASNCYIVSPGGSVNIPVSRANASDLGAQLSDVTTGWSSEVLWRDNAGLTITLDDGLQAVGAFTIKATDSSATGNAVVVIKDGSGTILWSWQIWVTDYDPSSENDTYNGYTFMDRNLGATSDAAGNVDALGLMYQWGRKDPFAGASATASGTATLKTLYAGASGSTVYSSENILAPSTSANNLETSVRNPGVFYFSRSAQNYDWYCGSDITQNDALWDATTKTVYDPCPSGWKVAPQAAFSSWSTSTTTWNSTNLGRSFTAVSGSWYPAAGYRYSTAGELIFVGTSGFYWSATVSGKNAYYLDFYSSSVSPSYGDSRANSFGVRCVQE